VTPIIPLADPLPQPAPVWVLWVLLQLTFFCHLLAMNLVLGGAILTLHWRASRRTHDADHRAAAVRAFSKALPVAVAAAVTLGVAPLLFVQVLYGRLFLTSSILMAWWWLAVIPLVILAYYGAYALAIRGDLTAPRATRIAAAVAVAFSSVAFLYTSNVTRALRPGTFVDVHRQSRAGLSLNFGDPTLWPRYLHMLLGAVAVAALAAALWGFLRRGREPEMSDWVMRRGTVVFGAATAVNIFVGMWFLLAQPREVLIGLVGADTTAMALLALGIVLAVASGGVALLSLGVKNPARATLTQVGVLLPTLVVMVLLRDQARQLTLRAAGFEHPGWVKPQWGPMGLFALLLLVAGATIAWMARALTRGSSPGGGVAAVLALALIGGAGGGAARAQESGDARVESALVEARVAAQELAAFLKGLLMEELGREGFDGAIGVCATVAQERTAEYRATFKNDIRRVSLRRRNPANEPDDYERGVLESFDRLPVDARPGAEHWEVVTENGAESLRYMKPLVAGALCLTCHGTAETMPEEVAQAVAENYPDDQGTGYNLGDVRGAITIRIPLISKR
jgi:hypothetical protein